MAKETKVEAEAKGGSETEVTPEPTPTPEEETSALRTQLGELETKLKEAGEEAKAHQRVATEKGQALAKQEEKWGEVEALSDQVKVLAAAIAQTQGKSEDEFTEEIQGKRPDLLKQFDQMQAQRKVTSFEKRVTALGLTQEDDAYWDVRDLVEAGKYERAEIKLKKLETQKAETSKEETKVPEEKEPEELKLTPEQEAELEQKFFKKHGMLPISTGGPSASGTRSFTRTEINAMSYEEFKANEKAIDTAVLEGRIIEE